MVDFLDVRDVLLLHADQIERYGGAGSLHDRTIAVTTGQTTKAEAAEFFRSHAR